MKIRIGFVSNSSSSSFCLIGARTKNTKFKNEEDYEAIEKLGIETADEGELIGLMLSYSSDDGGVEEDDIDIHEIANQVDKLPELLGTKKKNIKLFSGIAYG